MSWTEITDGKRGTAPRECWVGGYEQGLWKQTAAFWSCVQAWRTLEGKEVTHRISHWAPFLAPEPPPKPVSLLAAARRVCEVHADDMGVVGYIKNAEGLIVRQTLTTTYCDTLADAINELTDAIAREHADA